MAVCISSSKLQTFATTKWTEEPSFNEGFRSCPFLLVYGSMYLIISAPNICNNYVDRGNKHTLCFINCFHTRQGLRLPAALVFNIESLNLNKFYGEVQHRFQICFLEKIKEIQLYNSNIK